MLSHTLFLCPLALKRLAHNVSRVVLQCMTTRTITYSEGISKVTKSVNRSRESENIRHFTGQYPTFRQYLQCSIVGHWCVESACMLQCKTGIELVSRCTRL